MLRLLFPPKGIRAVLFDLHLDVPPDAFHHRAHHGFGRHGGASRSRYDFLFQSLGYVRSDARRLRIGVFRYFLNTTRYFFSAARAALTRQPPPPMWQRDSQLHHARIWLRPWWPPPSHVCGAFLAPRDPRRRLPSPRFVLPIAHDTVAH